MRRKARVDANHGEIVQAFRCVQCGATCPPGSRGRQRIYCSRICAGKAVGKKGDLRFRGAKNKYKCANCGLNFESYYKNRTYCSIKCTAASRIGKHFGAGGCKDLNQKEIVEALLSAGASVLETPPVVSGFPDLLVGFRGGNFLMEVKNPNNQYGRSGANKNQKRWWKEFFNSEPCIVMCPDDALRVIGAIK